MNYCIKSGDKNFLKLALVFGIIEYFDYILFVCFYPIISEIFLKKDECLYFSNGAIVLTVAYLSRPIGGLLFGLIFDKLGPRFGFAWVGYLSVLSSFGIAFLPILDNWVVGLSLLVFFRMLEGLAAGGDIPNLVTYIYQESKTNIEVKLAFVFSCLSIGSIFSHIVYIMYLKLYSIYQVEWLWRLPFFIAGMLSLLVFKLRKTFLQKNSQKQTFETEYVKKIDFRKVFLLSGFYSVSVSVMPIVYNVMPNFIAVKYSMDKITLNFISTVCLAFLCLLMPLSAYLQKIFFKINLINLFLILNAIVIPISFYYMKISEYHFAIFSGVLTLALAPVLGNLFYNVIFFIKEKFVFTSVSLVLGIAIVLFSTSSVNMFHYLDFLTQGQMFKVGLYYSCICILSIICYNKIKITFYKSYKKNTNCNQDI